MVTFGPRIGIDEWVNSQRFDIRVAITARTALRILPFLATELQVSGSDERVASLALEVFRDVSVTWASAIFERTALEIGATVSEKTVASVFSRPIVPVAAAVQVFSVAAAAVAVDKSAAAAIEVAYNVSNAFPPADAGELWRYGSKDATATDKGQRTKARGAQRNAALGK